MKMLGLLYEQYPQDSRLSDNQTRSSGERLSVNTRLVATVRLDSVCRYLLSLGAKVSDCEIRSYPQDWGKVDHRAVFYKGKEVYGLSWAQTDEYVLSLIQRWTPNEHVRKLIR